MIAVSFENTITLGAILTASLILVGAGVPLQLIRALRTERDEWREVADRRTEELRANREKLARVQARTDLEPVIVEITRLVSSVEALAATSTSRHNSFAQNLEANGKLLQGLVTETHAAGELLRELVAELQTYRAAGGSS